MKIWTEDGIKLTPKEAINIFLYKVGRNENINQVDIITMYRFEKYRDLGYIYPENCVFSRTNFKDKNQILIKYYRSKQVP